MARRRLLKHDTIYALSSGEGRAGVAIIRVSGPRANDCLIQMCKRSRLPTERRATRRFLFDAQTKEKLDDALVLRFPGPNSFTGEDIVEFHVHGSRSVITGVMDSLSTIEVHFAIISPSNVLSSVLRRPVDQQRPESLHNEHSRTTGWIYCKLKVL